MLLDPGQVAGKLVSWRTRTRHGSEIPGEIGPSAGGQPKSLNLLDAAGNILSLPSVSF